jgi:lipopolysaccharide export system protein LptA
MSSLAHNARVLIASLLLATAVTGARAQDDIVFDYACPGGFSGTIGTEYRCVDARLSDGSTTITAGTAETRSLDFDQSEWRLTGGIQVSFDTASLRAESAVFVFEADAILSFELVGSPASLTDVTDEGANVSGEAGYISYDGASETFELRGGDESLRGDASVRFAFGPDDITTCALTYNRREHSLSTPKCETNMTIRETEEDSETGADRRDAP